MSWAARLLTTLTAMAALCLTLLVVVLLLGQVAGPLAPVVRLAGAALPVGVLVADGTLILLDGALPLVALVATGLVFGRLRVQGAWVAVAGLGLRPRAAWGPAVALGLGLAVLALGLAHAVGPSAVDRLGGRLRAAAAQGVGGTLNAVPLPGGGTARRDGDHVFWAALPTQGGALVLRAEQAEARLDGPALRLELLGAQLWSPRLRLAVGAATVHLDAGAVERRLGMFGPPNSLPTDRLAPGDRHHRFVAARRTAQALAGVGWALLGAALGLGLGATRAVLGGGLMVAGAYGLLRMGELAARAGFGSPEVAAWAPTGVVLGLALLLWPRAWSHLEPR